MTSDNPSSNSGEIPRLAVVGCGAAAREFCLPVLSRHPGFHRRVVVVDSRLQQAEAVADEFGIQYCCTDYRDLPLEIDAAIVTTPHHLHAEQSIYFLKQGKPVLVEKPLGMTAAEVSHMLEASTAGEVPLMVNNCRRLFPAYGAVQELIRSQRLGAVRQVTIHDGSEFAWNSVTAFYVRNTSASRGVLLDRGAHTVDVLCWWLAGTPQVVTAQYDAWGGAEAVFDVQLSCGNAAIDLKFSRLHKLQNCYTVECDGGRIEGRLFDSARFAVIREGRTESITAGPAGMYQEYAWKLLENFIRVVQGMADPLFVAADVAPSISVIEQAYELASTAELPWYERDPNIMTLKAEQETIVNS